METSFRNSPRAQPLFSEYDEFDVAGPTRFNAPRLSSPPVNSNEYEVQNLRNALKRLNYKSGNLTELEEMITTDKEKLKELVQRGNTHGFGGCLGEEVAQFRTFSR
jgi:hypothetical protein